MSASKDRIIRKQQIAEGTDKRTRAAAEEAKKRRKTNIQYTIVGAILVVVFAFIFIYNSALPSRHSTAVTIDGEKYTVAQLNYYYSNNYMSFYNNYYDYISYGMFFDAQQSLKDQMYSEDMTWREYFLESAVDSLTEIHILNKAAEEAGFVLPAEDQAEYEEAIANIESSWAGLGYSSLEQYINLNYGKGVDMDLIRQELYRTYVASAYSRHMYDSYEYSPAELDAYYAEHADELDVISYAYVTDYDGIMDTDAVVAAVNGTDEDAFTAYMEENYTDMAPTTLTYGGSSLPEAYAAWLLDAARVPGDAAAFTEDDSATVVMFVSRDANDYHTVSFRHILKTAVDEDGDGAFSDAEIAAAADEAQAVYDEWQAGAATEDTFAEMANLRSDDGGSNTNGGLYETVTRGEMVEPIDTWLFDEARQPGDTDVISYAGDNYTGTHVVYFAGTDELTYAQAIAENTMRNDAFSAWMDGQREALTVTTSHQRMCGQNH